MRVRTRAAALRPAVALLLETKVDGLAVQTRVREALADRRALAADGGEAAAQAGGLDPVVTELVVCTSVG